MPSYLSSKTTEGRLVAEEMQVDWDDSDDFDNDTALVRHLTPASFTYSLDEANNMCSNS